MPAGKEIGSFDAKITSVRVREINGEERIIDGSYEAHVSGQLSGTATGTLTFTGLNDRGMLNDLGIGYLDSGDVLSYKSQGVYWVGDKGRWETRAAVLLGDQTAVVEAQITLANGSFSMKGKLLELT